MENKIMTNAHGEPYLVYELKDFSETLSPEEFWSKLPTLPLEPSKESIWTIPLFRSFFFGLTEMEERQVTLQVANDTIARDAATPVVQDAIGKLVQDRLVIDESMPYRPFMTGHDRQSLTYSNRYYPRRMQDYILQEYLPAYVLTGEERFISRAEELMDFFRFTRWKEDGTNGFVERYFPEEKQSRPEWAGGWDYVFDWPWKDGYGYRWSLHEPDHHVCAAIASLHVHMYERTGMQHYLDDARSFVLNQIPRYGFHQGIWNGRVYYWTEYNPTGSSEGNPVVDATDNVVALVAMAVAKVGYFESDPLLKGQLLEYARGLLWYMIREWETDGRWFYDGAENPMNQRKYKSHDIVCIVCSMIALVYLRKAGVDIAPFESSLTDMENRYAVMSGVFQHKAYLKMSKIYDGEPMPGNPLLFSTYFHVTGHALQQVRFRDHLADGISVADSFPIRISRLLPPDEHCADWRADLGKDRTLLITLQQLQDGIQLPFDLNPGETYRVSYSATCDPSFNRNQAVNPDSELECWLPIRGENVFVRVTTGSYGHRLQSYALPFSLLSKLNASNFLSIGANLLFPFKAETEAKVIEGQWPNPEAYVQVEPTDFVRFKEFVYPVHSLFPWNTGGLAFEPEQHLGAGRVCLASAAGQTVELAFHWPTGDSVVDIYADYTMGRDRGIVQAYVDGAPIGEPVNQYVYAKPSIQVNRIYLGRTSLTAGQHSLTFKVVDKEAESSGYRIGLHHAIRIALL